MKSFLRAHFVLIAATLVIFGFIYPEVIWLAGKLVPERANGYPVEKNGQVVGFKNIGQAFHEPAYFHGRPSAVGYDASATGGSNLGPSNPEYLLLLQARIDTLLKYHPGKTKVEIPADLIMASGSGLDPYISQKAAFFQAERVAKARNLELAKIIELIEKNTEGPLLRVFGPGDLVNVLKLNLALDELSSKSTSK